MDALPFTEALSYWGDKVSLGYEEYLSLSDAAKTRAFSVSRLTNGAQMSHVFESLKSAIAEGTTFEEFKANLRSSAYREDYNSLSDARLETVFRTNLQSAFMAGRHDQLVASSDVLPYYQYVTVGDSDVRPSHAVLHGLVYPAGHKFWDKWWPPNGFNCRCSVIGLTPEDIQELGIEPDGALSYLGAGGSAKPLEILEDDLTGKELPLYDQDGKFVMNVKLEPEPGFANNPGMDTGVQLREMFDNGITELPPEIAQEVTSSVMGSGDFVKAIGGKE